MSTDARDTKKAPKGSEIGELDHARDERRRAVWSLSMSERLAHVHKLSLQVSEIKGAARER